MTMLPRHLHDSLFNPSKSQVPSKLLGKPIEKLILIPRKYAASPVDLKTCMLLEEGHSSKRDRNPDPILAARSTGNNPSTIVKPAAAKEDGQISLMR
jgi:hypothetical protein